MSVREDRHAYFCIIEGDDAACRHVRVGSGSNPGIQQT